MEQFKDYINKQVVAVYKEQTDSQAKTVKGVLFKEDDEFLYITSFGSHTVVKKSAIIKLKVKKRRYE